MSDQIDTEEVFGRLPSEWNAVPAGTLINFKNGLNYSAGQVGTGRGVKVIGVGDFANGFLFRDHGLMRVEVPANLDKSYILKPNDLLFVRSNGNKELVGRVMFLDRVDEPVSHSGFTIRGRITATSIDPLFAAYFFGSSLVKQQFLRLGGGTNISNLSQDILKDVVFPQPPLPEQKRIAAILSTWDRAIELTEKLNAAKQQRKAALMQLLFMGKVRLPGFGEANWKKCLLGDVASNSTRRNVAGTKTPQVYSVTNSVGMVPMSEDVIGESIDRYKIVDKYDFAYNPMRINVGSIAMWEGAEEVLVSPDYVVFQCGPGLHAEFLNHFRKTNYWHQFVNKSGGGSVRVRIYFSDLAEMAMNLPPLDEQKAIAAVLNTQDREIELLQRKLDALKRQKKGLMQQLLTGRVRVRVEPDGN